MTNKQFPNDIDPSETQEWLDSLRSVVEYEGDERAQFILEKLSYYAQELGVEAAAPASGFSYQNSIPVDQQPQYPGDKAIEKQLLALNRWNAVCMVVNAGKKSPGIGGHMATYASAATLYAVGWFHFFKGPDHSTGGDLVFFQGHASPGMYSQAFLEGRLTEEQLSNFRREIGRDGLSSYPHPWLMPNFWQFATVSMGLGPIQAIYQARFLKYLQNRDLLKTEGRHIWAFCGDGEMDEPESMGALHIAKKERLDNLIFIVNCNLQRLDGPVRGNGSIMSDIEGVYRGAGWHVVRVMWGSGWDKLFAKDKNGALLKRMSELVDGDYQRFSTKDGAYWREHFFGQSDELKALVDDMSDEELWQLERGGHDLEKVYTAFKQATENEGAPTVVLTQTIKGYGLADTQAQNTTHNQKKLSVDQLKEFRDQFEIPISDDQVDKMPFYRPSKDNPTMEYLHKRREELGGYLPSRREESESLSIPDLDKFSAVLKSTGDREISNTMALVRFLNTLMKDKTIGARVVPIVPDESRSFGMEGMYRQFGIYSPIGQLYEPEDRDQMTYYKETQDGQILEEGLTEAGSMSSFIAAGTSYSVNNFPMIPVYIYYSMFGFQRIGDLAWAAGDMRANGFLIGAISGRTSLAGEGLQHQDGQNHLYGSTIPNCVTYEPCYGYELAVIMHNGLKRMYQDQERVFYYLTVHNENYVHPEMPKDCEQGIIKGMYLLDKASGKAKLQVNLLGSGTLLVEAQEAAKRLKDDFNVHAHVWSVTSFNELARDGHSTERWNRLHPKKQAKTSYVSQCLQKTSAPAVAVSDYVKAYTEQIRYYVPHTYYTLGTDGFGRSDQSAELRDYFEVDSRYIAVTALKALADNGQVSADTVQKAIKQYDIDPERVEPIKG